MESLFRYVAPPSACGYLPDRRWSLEYEMVTAISAEEYQLRLLQGWRRFGGMLFRPQCPACQACQARWAAPAATNNPTASREAWSRAARISTMTPTPASRIIPCQKLKRHQGVL